MAGAKRLTGVVFTTCLALMLPGTGNAVDFKGVQLGEPLMVYTERQVFGQLNCNPMALDAAGYAELLSEMQLIMPGARQICMASTSIAAVPADVTVVLGPSRRVLRLTFQFPGSHYLQVLRAMEAKWGSGLTEIRSEYDRSIWWEFEDGALVSVHQNPAGEPGEMETHAAQTIGLAEYSLPMMTASGDL